MSNSNDDQPPFVMKIIFDVLFILLLVGIAIKDFTLKLFSKIKKQVNTIVYL